MARRALLSETWWSQATAIPDDEREIAKHYTLDQSDLDLIMWQNKASNRLGLACVLAMLRFPAGRSVPIIAKSTDISNVRRHAASTSPCFSRK